MMHCGLLGQKLSHSYSPAIHSMLGDYEYKLYETEPENVETFLRKGDFDALNVTIPYKKCAAAICDELSETARAIGSVNTIVRRADGTLYGDNTDVYGFEELLRRAVFSPRAKKVLVLGSGGASAAVDAAERSSSAILLLTDDTALPRRCIRVGVMTAHPDELAAVLPALLASAERLRTLRDKTSSLQQRLDDSRIVARAKLLLISHLGMSEGDAHRYIEKTAMDSCLPRRDVAEGIIRTYEE